MFSFHKPKIYRSLKGCCICRAKSSSSRFTDSKRYENDFEKCFKIREKRSGEICNACVLLVKRWKKLPAGSNRNWHHVVDARAGPGTKSINKIKNKCKEELLKKKKLLRQAMLQNKTPQSPGGLSDDIGDDCLSDHSIRSLSPINSDVSDDEAEASPHKGRRRKTASPRRCSSFLDLNYWKKTEICCGIIFKGANGEVLLDTSLWRPCGSCKPVSLPVNGKCSRQNSECTASDSGVSTQDEEATTAAVSAIPVVSMDPTAAVPTVSLDLTAAIPAIPPVNMDLTASPPPPVLTPAAAQPFNNEAAACAVLDLSMVRPPKVQLDLGNLDLLAAVDLHKPLVPTDSPLCIQMEV